VIDEPTTITVSRGTHAEVRLLAKRKGISIHQAVSLAVREIGTGGRRINIGPEVAGLLDEAIARASGPYGSPTQQQVLKKALRRYVLFQEERQRMGD